MITDELDRRRAELRRRRLLPEPVRRQEATAATLAKFKGRPFDWSEGWHCLKLAHFHLRQMGRRPPSLPRIRSALAAKKALQARGFASVTALLDSLLPRIPAARLRLGDLAAVPGSDGLDSVMVYVAPHRLLTWLPDGSEATLCDVDPADFTGCWRATGRE